MKTLRLVATALVIFALTLGSWTPWIEGWGEAQARIRMSPVRGAIVYGVGRAVIRRQIVGGTVRHAERAVARKIQREWTAKALAKARRDAISKTVPMSRQRFTLGADHIADAQAKGHPSVLTVDRLAAKARRRQALKGTPTRPGHDRDEYPPSMFKEGGLGAHIRHLPASINRACGAYIGKQCSTLANGAKILLKIVE